MPIGPRPKPTGSRVYVHLPASPPTRCVSFSKIAVAKLITLFLLGLSLLELEARGTAD